MAVFSAISSDFALTHRLMFVAALAVLCCFPIPADVAAVCALLGRAIGLALGCAVSLYACKFQMHRVCHFEEFVRCFKTFGRVTVQSIQWITQSRFKTKLLW
jgi:hypothetical protein